MQGGTWQWSPLTLRGALERLGDLHVVHHIGLDAVAAALDLRNRIRECVLEAKKQAAARLRHDPPPARTASCAPAPNARCINKRSPALPWQAAAQAPHNLTLAISLGILYL